VKNRSGPNLRVARPVFPPTEDTARGFDRKIRRIALPVLQTLAVWKPATVRNGKLSQLEHHPWTTAANQVFVLM